MIVRITFLDIESKEVVMLFGTYYKNWFNQFEEYVWQCISWWDSKNMTKCEVYKILKVEKSLSSWIGYGGLKWCTDSQFQEELNEEAEGQSLKNPRNYQEMTFQEDKNKFYKARGFLREHLRHLKDSNVDEIKESIKRGGEARSNWKPKKLIKKEKK